MNTNSNQLELINNILTTINNKELTNKELTIKEKEDKEDDFIDRIYYYGHLQIKYFEDNLYKMLYLIKTYNFNIKEFINYIIESRPLIMADNLTNYCDILYEINYNNIDPHNISLIVENFNDFYLRRFLENNGFTRIKTLFKVIKDLEKERN